MADIEVSNILSPREANSDRPEDTPKADSTIKQDFAHITDLAERRRIQNRIAQRNYRKKLKKRLEDLEAAAESGQQDEVNARSYVVETLDSADTGMEVEVQPQDLMFDDGPATIKCVCGFSDDKRHIMQCEKCGTWQHIACYYENAQQIMDMHDCVECSPRTLDKQTHTEFSISKSQDIESAYGSGSVASRIYAKRKSVGKSSIGFENRTVSRYTEATSETASMKKEEIASTPQGSKGSLGGFKVQYDKSTSDPICTIPTCRALLPNETELLKHMASVHPWVELYELYVSMNSTGVEKNSMGRLKSSALECVRCGRPIAVGSSDLGDSSGCEQCNQTGKETAYSAHSAETKITTGTIGKSQGAINTPSSLPQIQPDVISSALANPVSVDEWKLRAPEGISQAGVSEGQSIRPNVLEHTEWEESGTQSGYEAVGLEGTVQAVDSVFHLSHSSSSTRSLSLDSSYLSDSTVAPKPKTVYEATPSLVDSSVLSAVETETASGLTTPTILPLDDRTDAWATTQSKSSSHSGIIHAARDRNEPTDMLTQGFSSGDNITNLDLVYKENIEDSTRSISPSIGLSRPPYKRLSVGLPSDPPEDSPKVDLGYPSKVEVEVEPDQLVLTAVTAGNETKPRANKEEAHQSSLHSSEQPHSRDESRLEGVSSRSSSSPSPIPDSIQRVGHLHSLIESCGDGEIHFSVDSSAPTNLHIGSEVEGRVLPIRPTEDSLADTVIGGSSRLQGKGVRRQATKRSEFSKNKSIRQSSSVSDGSKRPAGTHRITNATQCTDPNCTTCDANIIHRGYRPLHPDSELDMFQTPSSVFLNPEKSWSDRLDQYCNEHNLEKPNLIRLSHPLDDQTAWSALAIINHRSYASRFWYDSEHIPEAIEDAAEVALKELEESEKGGPNSDMLPSETSQVQGREYLKGEIINSLEPESISWNTSTTAKSPAQTTSYDSARTRQRIVQELRLSNVYPSTSFEPNTALSYIPIVVKHFPDNRSPPSPRYSNPQMSAQDELENAEPFLGDISDAESLSEHSFTSIRGTENQNVRDALPALGDSAETLTPADAWKGILEEEPKWGLKSYYSGTSVATSIGNETDDTKYSVTDNSRKGSVKYGRQKGFTKHLRESKLDTLEEISSEEDLVSEEKKRDVTFTEKSPLNVSVLGTGSENLRFLKTGADVSQSNEFAQNLFQKRMQLSVHELETELSKLEKSTLDASKVNNELRNLIYNLERDIVQLRANTLPEHENIGNEGSIVDEDKSEGKTKITNVLVYKLRSIIAEILGVDDEDIGLHNDFFSLIRLHRGYQYSLAEGAMHLKRVAHRHGMGLSLNHIVNHPQLNDMADYIHLTPLSTKTAPTRTDIDALELNVEVEEGSTPPGETDSSGEDNVFEPHIFSEIGGIDDASWKDIRTKLPESWMWDVDYHTTHSIHGNDNGCWTCTPTEDYDPKNFPLTISGIPVVLPVEYQWPLIAGVNPPPDPRPSAPIDCTVELPIEVIRDLFLTFEGSIGFYLLMNGFLQIIVPEEFDTTWASSHLPHKYGGLKVSYISQSIEPTMFQVPSKTETMKSKSSQTSQTSSMSSIFRSSSSKPSGVATPHPLQINDFIEARAKNSHKKEKFAGRIGLKVSKCGDPYLIMSTHVISEAILAKSHMGGIFSRRDRFEKLNDDWNEHIEIWAGNEKIGMIEQTFDPDAEIYPNGFKHDISLIKPTNPSTTKDIATSIPNLGWLSRESWYSLRQRTSGIKIIGPIESQRVAKSLKTARPSEVLVVGEGIFLNQGVSKPTRDHDISTWKDLVSRAVLYRVYPDFDPPNGYSGIALYAEGTREDGTEGPGVVGFQSFVQRSGHVQSFEMEGGALEKRLKLGRVAFYGAFMVPEELKREYSVI